MGTLEGLAGGAVRTRRFDRRFETDPGGFEAIARAREGDDAALRFLYIQYSPDVQRYVRSIVRDEYEAEDITQNVFAKLTTALAHYEPREVPFSAWILRIARNAALDSLRQRRAIPFEDVRGPNESVEQGEHPSLASLREALEELPDDQRRVVLMRHIVGLSPGEIADRMGKSEGSIHGLHHRARTALRAALVRLDAGPAVSSRRASGA
jgi:RNA polymerase sigma-70 factor (ECF subfamily)